MTPEDNTTIARPKVETRKRSFSLVWLMPVLAIVISGYVVWNNYNDRGPLITIVLQSGAGISAGATEVRIRDLKVGVVEDIGFSDGMTAVEVNVRLDKDIAGYVDKDAQFWLVEPQVTARGVTGIGTLLSGVYIAANWDGVEGEFQHRFTALTVPPLASIGEEGTRIVLRARAGGQLAAGAPVLTSGLEVGRIGQPELSKTGNTVTMEAFIFKPYDARLTSNTRFWDASGLSLNLGAQGLALKVDSLAALIEGGVTFGEPVTGGQPVSDGQVFDVFPTEAAARENAFEANVLPSINLSVLLDGDINGLNLDTLVRFRGIKAGEVADLVGVAVDDGSDNPVRLRVDLRLSPTRLGLSRDQTADEAIAQLKTRVANGLRARVGQEGLFGQTVILELVRLPEQPAAEITEGEDGRLYLPTAPTAEADPNSGVNGLVARLSGLPIEELMAAATDALGNVSRLTTTADGLLQSEGLDRIPRTLDATLGEVRTLVEAIRNGGAIDNLNATLQSADSALKSVDSAAASLPALAARLNTAAGNLEAVIAGYGDQSRLYSDLRGVLGDFAKMAESFRSLARSIERNPSSLIRGR